MSDNDHLRISDLTVQDILSNMLAEVRELEARLSADTEFSADIDGLLAKAEDHIVDARRQIDEL